MTLFITVFAMINVRNCTDNVVVQAIATLFFTALNVVVYTPHRTLLCDPQIAVLNPGVFCVSLTRICKFLCDTGFITNAGKLLLRLC